MLEVTLSIRSSIPPCPGSSAPLSFAPRIAVMTDPAAAQELARRVRAEGLSCEVRCGTEALEEIAGLADTDVVMAAIVGIAGLRPTLAAARAGKSVLLANKESLVSAGPVFMDAVRLSGVESASRSSSSAVS